MEYFGLERLVKVIQSNTPCQGQAHLQLDQVTQTSLTLNVSKDGASTAILGTTLNIKIFCISRLNPPSFSLKPLLLVLLYQGLLKHLSPSFLYIPWKYWKSMRKCPWSLLRAVMLVLSQCKGCNCTERLCSSTPALAVTAGLAAGDIQWSSAVNIKINSSRCIILLAPESGCLFQVLQEQLCAFRKHLYSCSSQRHGIYCIAQK